MPIFIPLPTGSDKLFCIYLICSGILCLKMCFGHFVSSSVKKLTVILFIFKMSGAHLFFIAWESSLHIKQINHLSITICKYFPKFFHPFFVCLLLFLLLLLFQAEFYEVNLWVYYVFCLWHHALKILLYLSSSIEFLLKNSYLYDQLS